MVNGTKNPPLLTGSQLWAACWPTVSKLWLLCWQLLTDHEMFFSKL